MIFKSGILCRNEKWFICKKKNVRGGGCFFLFGICMFENYLKNIFYINSQNINTKSILLI